MSMLQYMKRTDAYTSRREDRHMQRNLSLSMYDHSSRQYKAGQSNILGKILLAIGGTIVGKGLEVDKIMLPFERWILLLKVDILDENLKTLKETMPG